MRLVPTSLHLCTLEALAQALKSNMTLREIYLDNNKIGRWGVEALEGSESGSGVVIGG